MTAMERRPDLVRMSRAEFDLSFRPRRERAFVWFAYWGRVAARRALRLAMYGGCATIGSLLMIAPLSMVFPYTVAAMLLAATALGTTLALATAVVSGAAAVVATSPARVMKMVRINRLLASQGQGDRVRLRGRVVALHTLTAFGGGQVVFSRARMTRAGRGAEIEKAQDFLLDDGQETPARVSVAHAHLVGTPPPIRSGRPSMPVDVMHLIPSIAAETEYSEATVAAGDTVDVIGRLEEEVDPSAGDHRWRLERSTPIVRVLSGSAEVPLLIRLPAPD